MFNHRHCTQAPKQLDLAEEQERESENTTEGAHAGFSSPGEQQ